MSPITGIGVDLVLLERMRRLVAGNEVATLCRLFFTEAEWTEAEGRPDVAAHLGTRFAAKEAFLKALGVGLSGGRRLTELEVLDGALGQPILRVVAEVGPDVIADAASASWVAVSTTPEYALAIVILESPHRELLALPYLRERGDRNVSHSGPRAQHRPRRTAG